MKDFLRYGKRIFALVLLWPELAEDTACYFDPGNPYSIAEAISQFINNRNGTVKLGNQAFELAQKYTWDISARKNI